MKTETLLSGKQLDNLKLFDEMAVRVKKVIKDSDMPQPVNNGKYGAYLNLLRYWNDFLIKCKFP